MKIEIFNGKVVGLQAGGHSSELTIEATIHGLVPTVIVDGVQITGPVNGQPEGRLRPSSGPVADAGTVPSQTAG